MFHRSTDGILRFIDSRDAKEVAARNRGRRVTVCARPEVIHQNAVASVLCSGGNTADRRSVLANYKVQFGIYRDQRFDWMLSNCLGYSAWLVNGMKGETATDAPLSRNKFSFKEYLLSFPEGTEAVSLKAEEAAKKKQQQSVLRVQPVDSARATAVPSIRGKLAAPATVQPAELSDDELCAAAEQAESRLAAGKVTAASSAGETVVATGTRITDTQMLSTVKDFPLPEGWKASLPEVDQHWISRALFHWSKGGKAELDQQKIDRLWWYPPQPTLSASQLPGVDRYFAHRLLLWMPRRLWRAKLVCQQVGCNEHELTSAGLYRQTRLVMDVDRYYNIAAEYLECSSCKRKVISWSEAILKQLDVGHRSQFPAVLTYKMACDVRVVRLLRQRALGNSSTQLQRKLQEQHGEAWLQNSIQYMTDVQGFTKASRSGMLTTPVIKEAPQAIPVPSYKWLLTVYGYDVLQRLETVKASITSTFGRVLKLDSTKKVVKKIAGDAANTAAWATNVGNEHGQVLMSVLTASEGTGLQLMVSGLVKRYAAAEVDPAEVLYVDRDCCGESAVRRHFSAWPELDIRLDIWHFMRRFSAGVTTDAHRLYGPFMSQLSQCIFQWDKGDVDMLKAAKRSEMEAAHLPDVSDNHIVRQLGRKELALHCRRRTRGSDETLRLIQDLLNTFDSDEGRDTLGVPLLDHDKIWNIWESQKRHTACIQDPVDFQLYTQTGVLKKGTISLPVYRCARGSTSLESFHLHLNRFIPGTSASATHFQMYLVEGLVRWNEDRVAAALTGHVDATTYSSELKHAANKLSDTVFQKKMFPDFITPRKYTGEKIGIEYLYAQTGQVLEEMIDPDSADSAHLEELTDEDEGFMDCDLHREDETIAPVEVPDTLVKRPAPTKPLLQIPTDDAYREMMEHRPSYIQIDSQSKTSATPIPPAATASHTPSVPETEEMPNNEDESVGPDNIAGYGKVQRLAECLMQLKDSSSLAVTHAQASKIVDLWNSLLPHDQAPTYWPQRHQTKLTTGRFKPAKTTVAPGVESTRRCFLGQNTGPAQHPNCNRYVEAVISRLCDAFPNPVREGSKKIQRWSLVLAAYKKIRQMVLNNRTIMESTNIQLFEINQATLNQWYIKRSKKYEQQLLEQGLPTQPAVAMSTTPLPPPAPTPSVSTFTPATSEAPFMYVLPCNTSGEAGKMRRQQTATPVILIKNPAQPGNFVISTQEAAPQVPYTTLRHRKRKLDEELQGKVFRKYIRKAKAMICSKCKKERSADTHKQHYGNWFCSETSSETYEEWLSNLSAKGYGKKKSK